ncbi:hypothetical protein T439DRAFT_95726 [Meredithblackwellia eburnea MCA 4105]
MLGSLSLLPVSLVCLNVLRIEEREERRMTTLVSNQRILSRRMGRRVIIPCFDVGGFGTGLILPQVFPFQLDQMQQSFGPALSNSVLLLHVTEGRCRTASQRRVRHRLTSYARCGSFNRRRILLGSASLDTFLVTGLIVLVRDR